MPRALLLLLSAQCSQALRTSSTPRNGSTEHRPSLVSTLANRKEGETVVIAMMNTGNFQYTVETEIGGVYTKAIVDTGSFGLITTSKRCPADRCPIRSFDHEKAAERSNYRQLDATRTTYFSAGSLKMQAAMAPVLFGPGVGPAEIQFWEMTDMGKRMKTLWESIGFHAIAGFAWTEKVPMRGHPGKYESENTFLQNYEVPSFTLCLGNESRTMSGGKEYFTETPSRLYVGPPGGYSFPHPWRSTLKVHGDGHWAVKLSNIRVWLRDQKDTAKRSPDGPFPVDICRSEDCLAMIDSGTSIMTAPRMQFMDLMGATSRVFNDCTNFHQLPDILFTLGEGEDALDVILTPDHWVDYLKFKSVRDGKVKHICEPMIIGDSTHSSETPTWVLGSPVMRMFLWEYDRQKRQIRVADHPGECPGERSEPTLVPPPPDPHAWEKKYDSILTLARRPPNSTINFAAEPVDAEDEADLKAFSLPSERIDARMLLGEADSRGL